MGKIEDLKKIVSNEKKILISSWMIIHEQKYLKE